MHHLRLHVRAEIARIHAVFPAENQQVALRHLAFEPPHARLELLHARLRRLRALGEFQRGEQDGLRGIEARVGGLRDRLPRGERVGEAVEDLLEEREVEEGVGEDEAIAPVGGEAAKAELGEDLEGRSERSEARLEGVAGGVEGSARERSGVAKLGERRRGGLRCSAARERGGRARRAASPRRTATAAATAPSARAPGGAAARTPAPPPGRRSDRPPRGRSSRRRGWERGRWAFH